MRSKKIRIKKRFFHLVMVLVIIVYFVSLLFNKQNTNQSQNIKFLKTQSPISITKTPTPGLKKTLAETVGQAVAGVSGDYAIAVKNLNTQEVYFSNEHRQFLSTSLYKLWVMASVLRKIDEGKLTLEETLTQDVATLNTIFKIPNEIAEQTDGTISYTVKFALNKMITISDNYAALLLVEKIGLSSVDSFLTKFGFRDSRVGTDGNPPITSAFDTALFFEKLYKNQLTDPASTNYMLNLLKKQSLNSKIPKYLPKNTVVAHKTGELEKFSHDAGIVYTPNGDYIIVVLTESSTPGHAVENIAKISKAVYEYFNN